MELNDSFAAAPSIVDLKLVLESNEEQMRKSHLLVSRYNHEKATNKDYNGRQLLELIQNANDAGSEYVAIELDKAARRLRISNSGAPFTIEGFRSLMVPNLSSKIKKHYIGNKGLGFRSVLNWSEEVIVYSAGLRVRFSRELAAQYFAEWYKPEEQEAIRGEYGLAPQVIPFPLFAVPEIDDESLYTNQTVIDIRYRDSALSDIETQLKDLRPEVLLFLNHITEIRVSGTADDRTDKVRWVGNIATIGEQSWTVHDNKIAGNDPELPDDYKDADTTEQEYYSLKIAFQKDLKDQVNLLFSFFPTRITMSFPAVVHGTFELDSSRNRIIVSEKNKFLAGELLKLLFRVAMELEGWDRFRLLNYREQSDVYLKDIGFYQRIDDFLKTNAVLPCADGTFRSYTAVRILPVTLTRMIVDLNLQEHFTELLEDIPSDLKPMFSHLFPWYATERAYAAAILAIRIEHASTALQHAAGPRTYANWLVAIKTLFLVPAPRMLTVLYDDQLKMAGSSVTLFTPSSGSRIKIPAHVQIEYLHPDLYKELVTALNFNDANPPRRVKQELSNFAELQSFEPVPVLLRIIAETKTALEKKQDLDERCRLVRAMMGSLFDYYSCSDKAKNTELRVLGIPVINAAGGIITAREAFLSTYYPGGQLRQELLGDLYHDGELIASPDVLGIADDDDTERFLTDFLGVSRFVALANYEGSPRFDRDYQEQVFALRGRPDRFRESRISCMYIRNAESLKQAVERGVLSHEQFIAWLCVDDEVREIANRQGETRFEYANSGQTTGTFPNAISLPPSYVRYQLTRLGGFSDFVLDTDNIDYLNTFRFDSAAPCLRGHGISPERIREAQLLAGAKSTFADLRIGRIADILRAMPGKDPAGKYARKIYALCANRYRDKQEALSDKSCLQLHGTQDGQKRYAPLAEVYYNRKISLPARITEGKTLLNFPKRGAENNITRFFGVKTFDDIDFVANTYTADDVATQALILHFRRIRPLILVERLSTLHSSNEKKEAIRLVKSLTIVLCRTLNYTLGGELKEAELYDFIESATEKNTWLIRYSGPATIPDLVNDYRLSDAISEIWSIAFDLSNIAAEISFIFRDELTYTRRRLIQLHGEEELAEAESHLEVSEAEREFWRHMLSLAGQPTKTFQAAEEDDFRLVIAASLGISRMLMAGINYNDLLCPDNLERFQVLLTQLGITVAQFNRELGTDLSFYALHLNRWERLAANEKLRLNAAYWLECSKADRGGQQNYVSGVSKLEHQLAEPLAHAHRTIVEPNYGELLKIAILDRFPQGLDQVNDYLSTYQKNLRMLPATNFDINSWSQEEKSLLYFELSTDDLVLFREKLLDQQMAPSEPKHRTEEEENKVPVVTQMEKAPAGADRTPPGSDSRKNGHGGGGGAFGSGADADRRALGLRAEKMVLLTLRNKTYQWMSGYSDDPSKNDRAGYDIRYQETPGDDWTYIEVKWFGSGLFRLTDTEFNFAKDHADRYYIYLVTDSQIQKVLYKDLTDEDGEFTRNNDYFAYAVSEYKFRQLH
jgi:hypothetical protein